MAYLLGIETATKVCSVAIFKNEQVIASKEVAGSYAHSEKLAVFVKELLEESEIAFSELAAVLISKGPGSYTGLRIGVSFAKGLCYGLSIPLIAVDTLISMACGAAASISKSEGYLCPMIDARRLEVYTAIYSMDLVQQEVIAAEILDERFAEKYLDAGKFYIFGDGATKAVEIIKHPNLVFLKTVLPSAVNLIKFGYDKYLKKSFEDLAYFEPFYLKEFIALKSKKLI
tara:strand:- start:136 stop:822 length:687 start_codon:yes stop_codon:yes gene_type:complete